MDRMSTMIETKHFGLKAFATSATISGFRVYGKIGQWVMISYYWLKL